jgi:hypothetical protein
MPIDEICAQTRTSPSFCVSTFYSARTNWQHSIFAFFFERTENKVAGFLIEQTIFD